MNSYVLCDIIIEKNIQLSKEQIKKIEDFAVKAKDPAVALTLCCYTLDANVSNMLNFMIDLDANDYVAGFVVSYDGALSSEDFSKLVGFTVHNLIFKQSEKNTYSWCRYIGFANGHINYSDEVSRETFDNRIRQMKQKVQKVKKSELNDLEK